MQDAKNKGRLKRRPEGGQSQLSPEQRMEIRSKFVPYKITARMLASEYGVSEGAILHTLYVYEPIKKGVV